MAGCSTSYVCMIERGLIPPTDLQERLAAAVGKTTRRLWP